MRLASDFSYFGRKPAAFHVCKRSVGQAGVGARLWAFPGKKLGQGCGGEEVEVEEGYMRMEWGCQ